MDPGRRAPTDQNPVIQTQPTRESEPEEFERRPRQRPTAVYAPMPRRVVYVESVDPCCVDLVYGVAVIAVLEMVLYFIGFCFYLAFTIKVSTSNTTDLRDYWGHGQFYDEQQKKSIMAEETTNLIRSIGIAETAVCFTYVVLSAILLVGAFKRVGCVAYLWVAGVLCLSIIRLILLILAPLPVFQFGLIWLIFEIYFMFVVMSFYFEVKAHPDGIDYVSQYQVEVPMVEPVYSVTYAYPPTGYQLVPVGQNQGRIYVQGQPGSNRVPANNTNARNNRPNPSGDSLLV